MITNELTHHGILGMKWGVRKDKTNYRKDAFRLEKGTRINRAITNKDEQHTGHAYASFKSKDGARYAGRNLMYGSTAFNMEMKAKETLISPSKRERIDTFIDLMKNDKEFVKAYKDYKIVPFAKDKDINRIMSSLKNLEREYSRFQGELGGSKEVRNRYFSELSKKGYNMIIDDGDAGILADSPILVFDRAKSLEVVAVKKVTREYLKNLKRR